MEITNNVIDTNLFAERVKEARDGRPQEYFADKCKISVGTLSSYENATKKNGRMPTLENIARIAKASGISIDYMAGLVGEDRKELYPEKKNEIKLENYWDAYQILYELSIRLQGLISVKTWNEPIRQDTYAERPCFVVEFHDDTLAEIQKTFNLIEHIDDHTLYSVGNFKVGDMARKEFISEIKKIPLPERSEGDLPY